MVVTISRRYSLNKIGVFNLKTLRKFIYIIFACLSLGILTGCSFSNNEEVLATENNQEQNFKEVDQSAEFEKNILTLVNQYRASHGLPALELNIEISEIARHHSANMANGLSIWGHEGYDERTQMVSTIVRWEEIGENLARNNLGNPSLTAMNGWINSMLHKDNLIGDFTITGIGIARSSTGEYFFTQIFVRD